MKSEQIADPVRLVTGQSPTGETYQVLGGWYWIDDKVYCRGETYLGTCSGEEIWINGIHYLEVKVPDGWKVGPV
jgi:hypothetical protein